jgi:DNA-binding Xre family transcriptional regulator
MLQSTVPIVWKLEEYLAARGKTRYELASAMDGEKQSNLTTLYRLNTARRLDYSTLERLMRGLVRLTGERPTVGDLLEFQD